ncbi:MAG: hypothetical protein ACOH2F_06480 [Cellulomonas sp.]
MTALSPAALAAPAWLRPTRWRWWVQVLAVYGVARVVSAVILLIVAQAQVANVWTPASPSYLEYTGLMWDASWYRQIAEHGYPAQLPIGTDGSVQQNVWAFYPLFPFLVRGVMAVTGAPWQVTGPPLALVAGAAAMLVIHRVVEVGAPRAVQARPGLALATVTLVAFFPTAVVLQIAYTESLALLLIASALLLIIRRRYLLAVPVMLALGLTRAVALPMAVVVVVHGVLRWRASRRVADPLDPTGSARDDLSRREALGLGGLLVAAAVSGVAWQVVCGVVTGVPDGYLQTQASWRARPHVVPVMPWVDVSRWLFGGWGPAVLVLVLAAFVALLLCPPARRLGPELRAWPAAYLAYLVGVVEPGTSLGRFLLLAFPVAAITAGMVRSEAGRRRVWVASIVVVMVLCQVGWVWALWRLTPPSGWPP